MCRFQAADSWRPQTCRCRKCRVGESRRRGREVFWMLASATRKEPEGGVALILAMLAILILSVLAASIIFLSQTETMTTLDYRLTTQSRYAAEAGVQRTMNWINNNYTPPTTFTSYDMTKYPVQYSNNPV